MPLNSDGKDVGLDAVAAVITYLSLHTDVIGGGTANEVTGGTPAYARKAATWDPASAGSVGLSNDPVFDVPASTTIKRVGFFGHATASTPYYGDADITDQAFTAQGTYTVTAGTIELTG